MKFRNAMLFIVLLLLTSVSVPQSIVDAASGKVPQAKTIFKTISEEKEDQLKELIKERDALVAEKETAFKTLKADIEEYKNKKNQLVRDLQKSPDHEFLTQKLSLVTEIYDQLADLERLWQGLEKKITDHILVLEKYIKDPELKDYSKELKISSGPYFFQDLEDVYQKVNNLTRYLEQLKKRKETATKELKNASTLVDKITEEYKEKKSQLDDFTKAPEQANQNNMPFGFSVAQRAELLNLESTLVRLKKEAAELQLREKKHESQLLDDEIFIETQHLDIVQDIQQKIRSAITVSSEQIETAFADLEKKKQEFSLLKTKYNDEINKLRKQQEEEQKNLVALSKQYNIPLGNDLNNWNIEPKKALSSYVGLCQVGAVSAYVQLLEERQAYFATLITREQERLNYSEDIARVQETYYKIVLHKFASEEEITKEIKKYATRNQTNDNAMKSIKAKKDEADVQLVKLQNETADRIKKLKLNVEQQKESVFRGHLAEYAQALRNLDKAEEYVMLRADALSSISKANGEVLITLDKINAHGKFILSELESITIWYRPEYAISFDGIANVGNDIKMFFNEVRGYITQYELATVASRVADFFKYPLNLLKFILLLMLFAAGFALLQRYSSYLITQLKTTGTYYRSIRFISYFLALCVQFITVYSVGISIWLFILASLHFFVMYDPYINILFYLISIGYLLYLAQLFIVRFIRFNAENNYCFIWQDTQERFTVIASTLLNSTICLMMFRQAFILAKFPKSELPTILLAINLLIFQICLLFLISKEQVLAIFPAKYEPLQWIYWWLDRYYYFLMALFVCIIIMTNPYVGYGRLVLYLVGGFIWTAILIRVLLWMHGLIKRGASMTFFQTQEEVVRERFSYAKTWFGITLIVSFLILGFLGFILISKVWGWTFAFKDMAKWVYTPLLGIGKGTSSPLTIWSLAIILLFIIAGVILTFAFNRFVLERVFDLMLVDAGVQNAISSLTRYIFVIAAILLGFQSVGYGGLLTYVYVLILGIGYLIQNPLNDLVAYFIILVQRPIKVGDYIKIDEHVMGVVRKITPKSVMLRRKNSTTIVVPNTNIINKPIVNWNYSRNFIAFDDIIVTISFKEDPNRVKDILLSVLDAHLKILKNPKPVIRLDDFKEYGYQFMVRGFLSSAYTLEQWDVASDVRLAIARTLREQNIEIAVPIWIVRNNSYFEK